MAEYYKDSHMYDDIIDLPHYQSKTRVPMSLHDRAAQFAPFAALTGHEEAIEETARLTEDWITLDENMMERINENLVDIAAHLADKPQIAVTYFKPDERKSGGAYLTDIGTVKKIELTERFILMDSGIKIPIEYIAEVKRV